MNPLTQERQQVQNLCRDLQEHHHHYVRSKGPELLARIRAFVAKDTGLPLLSISQLLSAMLRELEPHMFKEEAILFPYCHRLAVSEEAFDMHCGSVANPIAVMQADHSHCQEQLKQLAELTHHYTPPPACPADVVAWLHDLQLFAEDLELHIYKEDHQLFPLAIQIETALKQAVSTNI